MNNSNTQALAMINSYLADNKATQCKAHYGEHYHLANRKNHTKDTYGEALTTAMKVQCIEDEYGFYEHKLSEDGTPLYSNPTWDKLRTEQLLMVHKKAMVLSPDFIERVERFKGLLKRNARRKANKGNIVSKSGKVTKYKRRAKVIKPSQSKGV